MQGPRYEEQVVPSAKSALMVVRGEPWGWAYVARDLSLRASIIGVGLFLAGEREPASLAKKSFAGAAAIEVAVLTLAAMKEAAQAHG
ncbi:MAG: hypothetical protein H6727_09300 [Myxococcales bacterium]|nr:hypothetical protein [Myxococcales bacterium]